MALLDPQAQPNPEREDTLRAKAGRIEIRPSERYAQLAVRSLACPACEMPLALSAPVGWDEEIACAFCESRAQTREFIRLSGWPEVELRARLG